MARPVLSWDEYFMGIAMMSALRSKDPRSQMGACIVNTRNRIVGVGYNGFPAGLDDDALPWATDGPFLETKYPYVCHAELNAILNSSGDLNGARMYIECFPCNECAKAIIQSGIREVVYMRYNRSPELDIFVASRKLFDMAGVAYRRLEFDIEKINLNRNDEE
jgi:dCMP deaminase